MWKFDWRNITPLRPYNATIVHIQQFQVRCETCTTASLIQLMTKVEDFDNDPERAGRVYKCRNCGWVVTLNDRAMDLSLKDGLPIGTDKRPVRK